MRNSTEAVTSKTASVKENIVIAFQDFNGITMAKASNLKGRETHAFGRTPQLAEKNALRNYKRKYNAVFS